jgi:hypothetical protein
MISVETVYQTVLALANKEQRGYISPQEFNLFANQAQMQIFESYFTDDNGRDIFPNVSEDVDQKLHFFKATGAVTDGSDLSSFPLFYRITDVYTSGSTLPRFKPCTYIPWEKFIMLLNSPLLDATHERPVYSINNNKFEFHPQQKPNLAANQQFVMNYIKKPKKANWTYVVIGGQNSTVYNPSAADHQEFELHTSEQNNLVLKILQLAGISIKDYSLTQVAAQKEAVDKQQ